jgi:microcystin-dependent protein
MATPFLGQITMYGFNFAPRGWALCNGQTLPINQNQALFSLLGTTYGGNGTTIFALPNLQGRVPVHSGNGSQGPGLSPYSLGEQTGSENVTLLSTQIPAHTHPVVASGNAPSQGALSNAVWATAANIPYASAANASMAAGALSVAGSSQPHPNMAPSLVVNFCITLQGIFPSRN